MNKFKSGPAHIFNPVPQNEEEALAHGNALAACGNYPSGTDECFNVHISGGCGIECFVYQKGECPAHEEATHNLTPEQLEEHYELYPKDPDGQND